MRLRKLKNSTSIIDNSKYMVLDPTKYKGKWKSLFNNSNPIYIEVGMGKGKFILENALKYPNINFIGIEKYDSAIARALKKIDDYNLDNLKIVRIDACELNNIFENEIDLMYLNFSDPWPKDRHEKRRLTSEGFLKIYDSIFKKEKVIVQKTDNRKLFEYSISSLSRYGYIIDYISCDLHKEGVDNINTEYEEKFMNSGPIYKAVYKK